MVTLRQALVVSVICHGVFFVPAVNMRIFTPEQKPCQIKVTYRYEKPVETPPAVQVTQAPEQNLPITVLKQEGSPAVSSGAEKMDKAKREKLMLAERARRNSKKGPEIKPTLQEAAKTGSAPVVPAVVDSIPGTTMPNTAECMSYYQYIRDRIQRYMKKGYKSLYPEGVVAVSFVLNSDGELAELDIVREKSSPDHNLHQITYDCLRDASPFMPLPKSLKRRQISFNLTIVFKKD